MRRHETRLADGTVEVEYDGGWLAIGDLDDIVAIVGGPTYTLEYDDEQASVPWLSTDPDNTLTFDVEETVLSMTHRTEFVEEVADRPMTGEPYPERTRYFADVLTEIWDSKGHLDDEETFVGE